MAFLKNGKQIVEAGFTIHYHMFKKIMDIKFYTMFVMLIYGLKTILPGDKVLSIF